LSAIRARPATPKKVGALPLDGGDEVKQTNEIGMTIPILETLDITGKTITTDALLTQRTLTAYLRDHDAHYVFPVKDNQPTLLADIRLIFEDRGQPDFREPPTLAQGRIKQRTIWTTTRLNAYLNFPGDGQAFVIERHTVVKKTSKNSTETVFGLPVISATPLRARPRSQPRIAFRLSERPAGGDPRPAIVVLSIIG